MLKCKKSLLHLICFTLFITIISLTSSLSYAGKSYALFSPKEGKKAFSKLYGYIGDSNSYVHASVYSWSDSSFDKSIEEALKNGSDVKIVLHPSLYKKSKIKSKVKKLEAAGAKFKVSVKNMHEKFVLIDDRYLINSSANMSNGAKYRYNENFVFHEKDDNYDQDIDSIFNEFKHEFTVLWNSSKAILTQDEGIESPLLLFKKMSEEVSKNKFAFFPKYESNITMYSSSMNWLVKFNNEATSTYQSGRFVSLYRNGGTKNQIWTVKNALIESIDSAKDSILVCLNHFNIKEVSNALIRAVKRGVDVKLAVDNQEFKTSTNRKEMTPVFVYDWKKIGDNKYKNPPVRVKYYSHSPSPRYWLLNHNKFILIDYKESYENTILLTGSYNVSKTAEHNQFDNLVMYTGTKHISLFKSFHDEFQRIWGLNRDTYKDTPKKEVINLFFSKKFENQYPLHISKAISLTWPEIYDLRKRLGKISKQIYYVPYKMRDCKFYDIKKEKYTGCPN